MRSSLIRRLRLVGSTTSAVMSSEPNDLILVEPLTGVPASPIAAASSSPSDDIIAVGLPTSPVHPKYFRVALNHPPANVLTEALLRQLTATLRHLASPDPSDTAESAPKTEPRKN